MDVQVMLFFINKDERDAATINARITSQDNTCIDCGDLAILSDWSGETMDTENYNETVKGHSMESLSTKKEYIQAEKWLTGFFGDIFSTMWRFKLVA